MGAPLVVALGAVALLLVVGLLAALVAVRDTDPVAVPAPGPFPSLPTDLPPLPSFAPPEPAPLLAGPAPVLRDVPPVIIPRLTLYGCQHGCQQCRQTAAPNRPVAARSERARPQGHARCVLTGPRPRRRMWRLDPMERNSAKWM